MWQAPETKEALDLEAARILVTGGAGFVGSNIVHDLLHKGAQVVVLDDFYTGSEDNLDMGATNLRVVRGSVTDAELVDKLCGGSDLVIHAAARNIIVSTHDPRADFETNVRGTLNVLLAARAHGVRRVVYTSSCSIYGNSRYLPINEDDPINILNPYAASKFAGEAYCKAFYESYGSPVSVVRYSNVFGPRQSPSNPYCGVIGKFLAAAGTGEPLRVHGDGEQTRDYTYVDDAVAATMLALVHPRAEGQMYNVGTGRETTVNQLAQHVVALTGSTSPVHHVDRRDIDNIRRRVLNIEKVRQELRWVPALTVEAGLKRTWQWMTDSLQAEASSPSNAVMGVAPQA